MVTYGGSDRIRLGAPTRMVAGVDDRDGDRVPLGLGTENGHNPTWFEVGPPRAGRLTATSSGSRLLAFRPEAGGDERDHADRNQHRERDPDGRDAPAREGC